ncbi:C40 family peptidase [Georgenia sp. MJ206]|uniref:C40 family peptidase n=1 Tax=Georgenia wangjunii TaxID=3117730 RepID=UPI002F26BDB0
MTVTTTGARHRAARRPLTPLSTFGQAVTGPVARRGMVVAASSGLAITMAASTAIASTDGTTTALPSVDVASLAGEARAALSTLSPSVAVPTDVEWSVEVAEAAATPPKAEVAAEPVAARVQEIAAAEAAAQAAAEAEAIAAARAAESASRTSARSEAPAAAASSSAAEAPAQAAQAAPAQNYSGGSIVDIAYRYVGTPYVWGGSTPGGFDCSGFTSYVFAQAGISLPRSSGAQRNAGTVVSASEARAGDLVWWPGHVGIYLGGGDYIAAHSVGNPLSARPIFKSNPTFIRVG